MPLLASTMILSACGGGSSSSGDRIEALQVNEYAGVWYLAEADNYLKITDDGNGRIYRCSLYDGYRADERVSLQVSGDIVTLSHDGGDEGEVKLMRNGEQLSLIAGIEEINYQQQAAMPDACNGNAVEITYVSPTEAVLGVEQTFVVNFDYRVADISAELAIAFTSDDGERTIINSDETILVDDRDIASGSITVNHTRRYQGDDAYSLYVLMYPAGSDEEFPILASDEQVINIVR